MSDDSAAIEAGVSARFSALASDPAGERRFAVGRASALALGYAGGDLDLVPAQAIEAFAGVGNPFSLGRPRPGDTLLDLGCGAGTDALLAARWVGPGRVIGIDMVPGMIARARRAAAAAGAVNVEFRVGRADSLPLEDMSADIAITNGVFNLCVDKPRVASELYRVLRPGGRLQMADILLEPDVPPEEVAARGAWSD